LVLKVDEVGGEGDAGEALWPDHCASNIQGQRITSWPVKGCFLWPLFPLHRTSESPAQKAGLANCGAGSRRLEPLETEQEPPQHFLATTPPFR
jgi:hypothetical protein